MVWKTMTHRRFSAELKDFLVLANEASLSVAHIESGTSAFTQRCRHQAIAPEVILPGRMVVVKTRERKVPAKQLVVGVGADQLKKQQDITNQSEKVEFHVLFEEETFKKRIVRQMERKTTL